MIIRDFFLGFVRIHVPRRAAEGLVYALALLDELRQHGHARVPGTRPLLHELEEIGYPARRIS